MSVSSKFPGNINDLLDKSPAAPTERDRPQSERRSVTEPKSSGQGQGGQKPPAR